MKNALQNLSIRTCGYASHAIIIIIILLGLIKYQTALSYKNCAQMFECIIKGQVET